MYKLLKRSRVVISLLILVVITLNFLYFANRETLFFANFLKIQFVPALLGAFTGSGIIFSLLIILTLFFGRVYCSTLCPLGTLQDIFTKVAGFFKSKKKRRFSYSSPKSILRYSLLALGLISLIFGITSIISYLDPYSNFGRISTELIGRAEQLIQNGLSAIVPESVFFRTYSTFVAGSFVFAAAFLILIIVMSAFWGRLYCNTICPVGTFLGLLSRFSMFKPKINSQKCNHCNLCIQNCKSGCIDTESGIIDQSRCVACLDCMNKCKKGAVSYKFSWKKEIKEEISKDNSQGKLQSRERREAIIAMGLMGTLLASRALGFPRQIVSAPKITGIAPPGAGSIENLKKNCTACQACISACPNGIIKPATTQYGLDGILMPVLSFEKQFCGFDCTVCNQVCPNGALKPLSLEEKKLTQIGRANFRLKKCIVYTDKTDCGACDEHCPTKAITMIPYRDTGLFIPKLNKDICIGCGGCQYVCPATPEKAITVSANEVHKTAQKPTVEKQEKVKVDSFGF